MHTKDRMARLQMETTLAVLGDHCRYPTEILAIPFGRLTVCGLIHTRTQVDPIVWHIG